MDEFRNVIDKIDLKIRPEASEALGCTTVRKGAP